MSEIRRKLVIVGDGACGKVCLFCSWRLCRRRRRTTTPSAEISLLTIHFLVQTCLLIVFSKGTFPEVSLSFLYNAALDP